MIQKYNQFITESLDTKKLKENQKRLREYIKILKDNDETIVDEEGGYEYTKHDYPIKYFKVIHNDLLLEEEYYDEVKLAKKEINKYLDLPKLTDVQSILDKFKELYDRHHKVRFAVETLDSIEEIRQYFIKIRDNRKIDYNNKIYFKLPQL